MGDDRPVRSREDLDAVLERTASVRLLPSEYQEMAYYQENEGSLSDRQRERHGKLQRIRSQQLAEHGW